MFSVSDPNRALNVTYTVGNAGYWPFWLYVESACYFCNVSGTEVGTSIGSAGISFTEIRDPNDMVTNIQAVKNTAGSGNVRIKISVKQATNFIGIAPVRLGFGNFVEKYESLV